MSTQATTMPPARGSQAISAARRMYWLVRRELWESRSIYLAPLAVAALIGAASLIGAVHLPVRLHALAALDPVEQHRVIEEPYTLAALLIMFTTMVVGIFYSLDALYGERRDRSVLFWKSMPVSDTATVLAKASIPLLVLPLVTFAITVVTYVFMLLLGSARMLVSGQSPAPLWAHLPFLKLSLELLYHLVAFHGLWWAPYWGWLLLVSAWSRRTPFLWAVLPPLAVAMLERIAFRTTYFGALLGLRFGGGPDDASSSSGTMTMASMTPGSPAQFLLSPGMWMGLAVAAALLAAAVRLRRWRGPI